MFEGAIAAFLNRLLGKYIEDLDTEQFNVGIFSGDTCLTDLKLKPEALYQLGLPIKVEVGLIGRIVLKIPWSGLFSQPIILCIEDVYVAAVPAAYGPYDAEVQKKLLRAEKRKILEDLKEDEAFKAELFDNLLASVTKNFQISINNVHIRYEEKLNGSLCACGICIQSISVMTTNSKWKPGVCGSNSNTIYQLIRAESLSIYMDHDSESALASTRCDWDMSSLLAWKTTMHRALQTFGMKNKEFQFLLKPFTAKIKVIIHKGNETQTSRMLVDIVLHDVAMQVSKVQYITFCHLYNSMLRAIINKPYVKYRPSDDIKENPSAWWKYAYNSILDYNIRPYTWARIIEHRKNYRKYKEACLQNLLRPNDTELKLDLQKYEDCLTILNMVIAREHAKQELKSKTIEEKRQNMNTDILVQSVAENTTLIKQAQNNDTDEQKIKASLHYINNDSGRRIKLEKLPQPIDYKFNFTLANCCLSLLSHDREILVVTVTQLLTSVEIQSLLSAFKVSARAESFVIEGVSAEGDLVPLITVDNVLTGNVSTNILAIDFEKNRENVDPTFDVSVKLEAVEVTYYHHAMIEIVQFFKLDDSNMQTTILWAYKLYKYARRNSLVLVDHVISQTLRINFKVDIKGPYIVFPEHGSIQKGGHILIVDFGNVSLSNELQAVNLQLEDATLMELEELLYDRIHVEFSGAQILFCHSGDDWRSVRKKKDSEYHFLPKIQATTTISCSIKPEYHQLPRSVVSSEVSEEDLELLSKTISLSGFDDNVSPYNHINFLLRFAIGEVYFSC
ncbi:Vacuolar protein sorting-associated protein 13C [Melipona quadrifasciata]|uniref:Vacuolar protein sorting-associated protein 13C n=1 Tax=Melipona quadrifasciata TaxID=166423 RepID=A0A0M9AA94_9HYME|nr:Vacuolar protein sorting-associated protein 13C [Melipona quadrifasciata]